MSRSSPLADLSLHETKGATCIDPVDGAATPLRAGLAAAVAELDRTAAGAAALQNSLSPLLLRGGDDLEACQALDQLTQQLHGLADFLTEVARACPMEWRFDLRRAGDPLRLHAQKLRLVNGCVADSQAPAHGDVELW